MSTSLGPCKGKALSAVLPEPLGTWRIKTPKLYSLKHQGSVILTWQCAMVSESLGTDKMSLRSWSIVRGNPPASPESCTQKAAGGLSVKLTKRQKQKLILRSEPVSTAVDSLGLSYLGSPTIQEY